MARFDPEETAQPSLNKYAIYALIVAVAAFAAARMLHFEWSNIGLHPLIMVVVASPLVLVFTYLNLELALVCFIYTIPIVIFSIPDLPFFFTFADAFLIVLAVVWFSKLFLKKDISLYSTFLDKYLFLFAILSVVSTLNSRDISGGIREIVQTLEFCVITFYLFSTILKSMNNVRAVVQAMIFSSFFFSLYGVYQFFTSGGGEFRAYAMMGHSNAFGAYVCLMMLMTLNTMLGSAGGRPPFLMIGILAVDFAALMLTYSRGAWIALVAGVIVSAWLRGLTQFVKVFSLIIVLMILFSMVLPQSFIGRAASITRFNDDASTTRLKQYRIAGETMMRFPLLGVGAAAMPMYVQEEYQWLAGGEIHNLFFWIGSERGVPAMLALLAIFAVFFIKSKQRLDQNPEEPFKSLYIGVFTALFAYFIINLTALQMVRGLGMFFGILLGLYQAAAHIEDEQREAWETPFYIGRATTILR